MFTNRNTTGAQERKQICSTEVIGQNVFNLSRSTFGDGDKCNPVLNDTSPRITNNDLTIETDPPPINTSDSNIREYVEIITVYISESKVNSATFY